MITDTGIGAWLIESPIHRDGDRLFVDICRTADLPEPFAPTELAVSVAAERMVRGIHFAAGRAKVVTCVSGYVWDVAVDLRPGSPTFGRWHGVWLGQTDGRSMFLAAGMGHGFYVHSPSATIVYAMDPVHDPETDKAVHPFDPELAIEWPVIGVPRLSERDANAPMLAAVTR